MELSDYVRLLRRYWVSIVVAFLASTLVAGIYLLITPPTYSSTSQLYVSVQSQDGSVQNLLQGSNYTQNQVTAFAALATSPLILEPVVEQLGLDTTANDLRARVSGSAQLNTPLINVTATAASADEAAALSNAVAESMAVVLPELQRPAGAADSPVKITVTRAGQVPTGPSEPNTKLTLALGALVGLALGVGIAVLRGTLDTRLRTEEDVALVTDRPVLGVIGFDKETDGHPLALVEEPHGPRAEEVRRLRTNLQFVAAASKARILMVTSPLPSEGKSTTTANLALALADTGLKVVLVDGDLRKPRAHKIFGVEGTVGLTTVLIGRAEIDDVVQPVAGHRLDVLAAGEIPPNPSELLGSMQMLSVLDALAARYDVVVIDSAPVLPVSDAIALSTFAQSILVIAASDGSSSKDLASALESLDAVQAPVSGVVLNRVARKDLRGYGYSYEYRYESEAPAGPRRDPVRVERRPGRTKKAKPSTETP